MLAGLAILVALPLGTASVGPAAAATRQPSTMTAAVRAARHSWVTVQAASSSGAAKRGIAYLFVSSYPNNTGPGCQEVWGYTGTVWKGLGHCNQDFFPYPAQLPGKLIICRDTSVTVIRSGPGTKYSIVARVRTSSRVSTDQFRLTLGYVKGKDGVGYYRILWHGKHRWVASYRVVDTYDKCSGWSLYWRNEAKHR
jgi:hypothetical protein